MDEEKEQENNIPTGNKAVSIAVVFPDLDEETRKKITLAIYHDGLQLTTVYVNNVLEKFRTYFNKILIVSEDEENLESLNYFDNVSVVSILKPINLKGEWLLVLEPGEFPSIQLLNNLGKILNEMPPEVKIVKLPLVVCHFKNGEIIDILKPGSRLYRQNPQVLQNREKEEIILEDYPIIKLYVDFTELEANS
jgi:hypothetical protein